MRGAFHVSAKTIRDSGIAAAEFSMTLLRKIEELTQYTIERQKLIEKPKS